MPDDQELAALARAIIDANLYMVLGTADSSGTPWVSPVYYAPVGYREFFWISAPEARHSQNVVARREVGIVVFDSSTPIDTGQGVYMTAVAEPVAGVEVTDGIEVFSRRSLGHGGRPFTASDVRAPARHRLFRATALQHYVLQPGTDRRVPVTP
jgi:Pyridoxamine 5'-phosphate oxidase